MIPLKLQLRNFMSYRENVAPLLFDGFRLACLSGENGHGKSALLDAITWALWGKARAKSEDELIHHGKTEMEVEFEFDLGGTRYRVLRKRALRGGGGNVRGVGSLDLQVCGEEGAYRSVAGNTMHETQRRLSELLRMEYDTFVNSAFILQGKADAFTLKPPADRKKVLADLLGLDAYDAYEEMARERAREADARRREEIARKAGMESEAARRPEYEAQALQHAAELADLALHLEEHDRRRAALREERSALEAEAAVLKGVNDALERARADLADVESTIAYHRQRVATAEGVLARRETVEAGHATWQKLVRENEEANARLSQLAALQKRREGLTRAIVGEQNKLQVRYGEINAVIGLLRKRIEGVPAWEEELAKVTARLAQLADLEQQQKDKRASIQSLNYQVDTLVAVNAKIETDGKLLKEKIELLVDGEGRCPLCDSELGAHGLERLREHLQEERLRLVHDYRQNQAAIKELQAEARREQKALESIESELTAKTRLVARVAELQKSLADAAEAGREVERQSAEAAALAERLERRDYAHAEQAELAVVDAAIAALGYDAAAHAALRKQVEEFARFDVERQRLEAAEAILAEARPQLQMAEQKRERILAELAALEERRRGLMGRLERSSSVHRELEAVEREIAAILERQTHARQGHAQAQQMINHCKYLEKQCAELSKEIARLAEEKSIYDELAVAFGKKGIQAMIIETAVPELEDEANALLARMTDGRMRVKFETQRAAKSSDAVIETLDIRIADELGTRSYELFSGGEAFKVNFAIRIALSKLLARRAGARLEMLVIDEGFGTQDAQGRERLVEAINEVSHDFSKILVITHIEELKDAFPVRIDVLKTAEGSQLSMS